MRKSSCSGDSFVRAQALDPEALCYYDAGPVQATEGFLDRGILNLCLKKISQDRASKGPPLVENKHV